MMKKVGVIILIMLFACTLNAGAVRQHEMTYTESEWENYIETAELKYAVQDGIVHMMPSLEWSYSGESPDKVSKHRRVDIRF